FDARTVNTTETIITNARHTDSLKRANQALIKVADGLENNIAGDLLAMEIRYALDELGSITGEVTNDELLNSIFTRFCIGICCYQIFGSSLTLLRLIYVFSLIVITIIFDHNLKRFSVSVVNRLAVLMLFVFNPLTISLSNSFMTDLFQLLPCILAFQFMLLY